MFNLINNENSMFNLIIHWRNLFKALYLENCWKYKTKYILSEIFLMKFHNM